MSNQSTHFDMSKYHMYDYGRFSDFIDISNRTWYCNNRASNRHILYPVFLHFTPYFDAKYVQTLTITWNLQEMQNLHIWRVQYAKLCILKIGFLRDISSSICSKDEEEKLMNHEIWIFARILQKRISPERIFH